MTDPIVYTKDAPVKSDVICDAYMELNRNKLHMDIRYWYLEDERTGDMLVTDCEVKAMFYPAGFQEHVMEVVKAYHPDVKVTFENGFKTVTKKEK